MEAPDLVIPIRLENAQALRDLKKLEQQGEQASQGIAQDMAKASKSLDTAGQEGEKAGRKIKKGMEEGASGADKLGASVTDLIKAQVSLQLIERIAGAMGNEFKRASDYVTTLAKDFAELRQSLQQVAALTGKQNTNEFTVEQVKKATQASLTPEEWKNFQEEFQSAGGAYIEGEQNRFVERKETAEEFQARVKAMATEKGISETEAAKMTAPQTLSAEAQAEQYQQKIAEFGKARNFSARDTGEIAGGLLQFSEGPQKVEDLTARFGRVFKTLERAPTQVAQLIPQMGRVMSQGASPEEAAQLIAIQSEANKGEEEVHVRQPLKKLDELIREGKGKELGITGGMSALAKIQTASEHLMADPKIKAAFEQGEEFGKGAVGDRLAQLGFNDRELTGMVGFVNRGARGGGFKRVKGYIDDTPRDFLNTELQRYEQSDAGQQAKRDADERLAKAERGAKYQGVMAARQTARTELIREGEPEAGSIERALRGTTGFFTGQSAEQQIESQRALYDVRLRARKAGVTEAEASAKDATVSVLESPGETAVRSAESVNQEILTLLKLIAEHTKGTAENTKANKDAPAGTPVAPRPKPAGPPPALPAIPTRGPGRNAH